MFFIRKRMNPVSAISLALLFATLVSPVWGQTSVRHEMLVRDAAKGNAEAQYQAGFAYASGYGVEQNYIEAAKWYRKAAEQGIAQAQHGLAMLFADGKGVPKDPVEALKWYDLAIWSWGANIQGVFVKSERSSLAKKLSPERIAKAQALAVSWIEAFRARKNEKAAPTSKQAAIANTNSESTEEPKETATTDNSGDGSEPEVADDPKDEAKFARVLHVGPGRKLKNPSAAARAARSGDLIKIDAGTYKDCAVWRTPNITIRGTGGFAHVKDISCDAKAIWVFYAAPVRILNVRFSHSRVPNRNGAGIRWEGGGLLIVRNSWFHNNQMGILTHNVKRSQLVVTNSRFEENGDCFEFCGHGIYAGRIYKLTVSNSRFAGHKHGHHIKSRAYFSEIMGNRIVDGPKGTASFAINLPDSGTASITYNFIEKGPQSDNKKAVIAIGEEGAQKDKIMNPSRGILIENNTFQNNNRHPSIFIWNRGWHTVHHRNNRFHGKGIVYR